MRITKIKAKALLEQVEETLDEARKKERMCRDEIAIWECARAYLEFLIQGIPRNPSIRKKMEDEDS